MDVMKLIADATQSLAHWDTSMARQAINRLSEPCGFLSQMRAVCPQICVRLAEDVAAASGACYEEYRLNCLLQLLSGDEVLATPIAMVVLNRYVPAEDIANRAVHGTQHVELLGWKQVCHTSRT